MMQKRIFALSFSSVVLLSACAPREATFKSAVPALPAPAAAVARVEAAKVALPPAKTVATPTPEPAKAVNWNVPFFPQAPDADWSLPWQEACEEASVVLAYHYATGIPLDRSTFRQDVLDLVAWQKKAWGDYIHSDMSQTLRFFTEHYGFSGAKILQNPTAEDLKNVLRQGSIIVAPFAGRRLLNPFYSGIGPIYHVLVIRGFDETHFITNDVGTKRGQDFIYPIERVMQALHDWNGTEEAMEQGPRRVIVVTPQTLSPSYQALPETAPPES